MAQSDSVAPAALFVLRAGNGDPVTAPLPVAEAVTQPSRVTGSAEDATGPVTGSEPRAEVTPLPVPLTPAERAHLAAKHWAELAANGAGQMFFHPGRIGHAIWHGQPESVKGHVAYVKTRAWVPPELDGKAAKTIAGAGLIYHFLVGIPLKSYAETWSAAAERPLRLAGLVLFHILFALFVIPLILIPLHAVHL